MKVYISGPISLGDTLSPDEVLANCAKFPAAAADLQRVGIEAVDPTHGIDQTGLTWIDYMRRDLHALVDCDGIAMLDGWEASRGACVEEALMRSLGLPVATLAEWLASPLPAPLPSAQHDSSSG